MLLITEYISVNDSVVTICITIVMFTEFLKEMLQAVVDYGDVVRFWLGTSLYILISNTKDIEVQNRLFLQ